MPHLCPFAVYGIQIINVKAIVNVLFKILIAKVMRIGVECVFTSCKE